MARRIGLLGLFVLITMGAEAARADRTQSVRASGQKNNGSKVDITVPYLTTGNSAFGAYSVAPKIYSSSTVDDPKNPQSKPVYNLPFYGAQQGFGDKSNGAKPK